MLHLLCFTPTDQACTEEKQRQCSGWQSWLRATPIFKDCHCRVTTAQKADCMDIQRSVFDDYCGNGNISTYKQCNWVDNGWGTHFLTKISLKENIHSHLENKKVLRETTREIRVTMGSSVQPIREQSHDPPQPITELVIVTLASLPQEAYCP